MPGTAIRFSDLYYRSLWEYYWHKAAYYSIAHGRQNTRSDDHPTPPSDSGAIWDQYQRPVQLRIPLLDGAPAPPTFLVIYNVIPPPSLGTWLSTTAT